MRTPMPDADDRAWLRRLDEQLLDTVPLDGGGGVTREFSLLPRWRYRWPVGRMALVLVTDGSEPLTAHLEGTP